MSGPTRQIVEVLKVLGPGWFTWGKNASSDYESVMGRKMDDETTPECHPESPVVMSDTDR